MFKDLTPKVDRSRVQTVKLPPYRVSDEALRQIAANERQAARCLTDTTLFD